MKKALIVDDEDMMRVLLTQTLERAPGLKVLTAGDGIQALQIIQEEQPELILLDVLLPKLNGYDVCFQARQIADYTPYIIVMTARGHNQDRDQAARMGADDFMTKPFNPTRLLAKIKELPAMIPNA